MMEELNFLYNKETSRGSMLQNSRFLFNFNHVSWRDAAALKLSRCVCFVKIKIQNFTLLNLCSNNFDDEQKYTRNSQKTFWITREFRENEIK